MNQSQQLKAVRDFFEWLGTDEGCQVAIYDLIATGPDLHDPAEVMDYVLAEYQRLHLGPCDTAIAHGPGHQSVTPCGEAGPHELHVGQGRPDLNWKDEHLSGKTRSLIKFLPPDYQEQATFTYRLAFTDFFDQSPLS